jgi:DNA-binding Lrp family transcriptional regulator
MKEILDILKKDARLSAADIALMLNRPEDDVAATIKKLEDDRVILAYKAIINPEETGKSHVSAFIEVSISPEKKTGFDAIAKKLYTYPQVKSLYLMSGGYDFLIEVEGNDLKDVAYFISERLSVIGKVQQTSTHFLLKKYKENGVDMINESSDDRVAVMP